jgi:hypothetical protein
MDPEACRSRIEEINAQVASLRERRATLTERLGQLAMPTLDLAEVAALMDDFERVFESGLNAQKKHLLHQPVKEVRVKSRDTAEVWYAFPQPAVRGGRTVDSHIWLRRLVSVRTAPRERGTIGTGRAHGRMSNASQRATRPLLVKVLSRCVRRIQYTPALQ